MAGDAEEPAARRDGEVAASLMRMALALLDRLGEALAAVHLQHAVDTLERRSPGEPTGDDLARIVVDRDADSPLARRGAD